MYKILFKIKLNQISFTLYPAHSRVGRGNLVLKHSIPHFYAEFWRHWVLSGGTQRHALPRHQCEEMKINKYFISSSGDRTHNQSILQSHFVPLRHDQPQLPAGPAGLGLSLLINIIKLKNLFRRTRYDLRHHYFILKVHFVLNSPFRKEAVLIT